MNWQLFVGLVLCAIVFRGHCVVADETQIPVTTIPLDQIWAYRMPNTRPMSDFWRGDTKQPASEEVPLVREIRKSLKDLPTKSKKPLPGFAVRGTDMEAIRQVRDVLVDGLIPTDTFTLQDNIWLVFFSYQGGAYVQIHDVQRQNTRFEIRYRVVPHRTRELTEHIALIPAGKLPSGSYRVEVEPEASADAKQLSDASRDIVSGGFSFSVD